MDWLIFFVNCFMFANMKKKEIDLPKTDLAKIGRPRAFDQESALNAAMLAFWKHGYETTSMSVLSKEMKMNPPSIYAAFGDKQSIFLKALDLYVGHLSDIKTAIDESASAFEAAGGMLRLSAVRFTGKQTPKGCMLASAVATGSAEASYVRAVASKIRLKIESFLKDRVELDILNQKLPKTTSSEGLAALTIATIQGMSVLARDGASRKKLILIAETSQLAWPQV